MTSLPPTNLDHHLDQSLTAELDFLLCYHPDRCDQRIQVAVVDNDELSRRALVALLHELDDLNVVADCSSCRGAVDALYEVRADVILINAGYNWPSDQQMNNLGRSLPQASLVMIAGQVATPLLRRWQENGLAGTVMSSDSSEVLLACLRAVALGDNYLSQLAEHWLGDEGCLTARQEEIVALLASGRTNRQIAEQLIISERTVESHRAEINSKLDIGSRADLFDYARAHALI